MKGAAIAASLALALVTYFQFPGHTWLQQDSQIYAPILEHLHDSSVLRNDILAQQPHVTYTIYDEAALFLRALTHSDFHQVLAVEQVAARACGIYGLYLAAAAMGLEMAPALLVAAIVSLGAAIVGPAVLTFEYEPTPRAFAVPLLICAMGLTAQRRLTAAATAAAVAFLFHPPTAVPFLAVFAVVLAVRREFRPLAPLAAGVVLLWMAAHADGGSEAVTFFGRLAPLQEQLQRLRASYVWISTWRLAWILHYLLLSAILTAAFLRLRHKIPGELAICLLGLPLVGLLTMPSSAILLERMRWALLPEFQPMRALLFVVLSAQILTAAAGISAAQHRRPFEALAWFTCAYLPPLQLSIAEPFHANRAALAVVLAAATAFAVSSAPRFSPAVALAAFFAIPALGGVVNYPHLATPELSQLSTWARSSTPKDAVFAFPDAGHALHPGIFRSDALRAVYVDWKGGGQVNYLKDFGEQWWFRWQQTMVRGVEDADLPRFQALGIAYVVLQLPHRLPRRSAFENTRYVAYATGH